MVERSEVVEACRAASVRQCYAALRTASVTAAGIGLSGKYTDHPGDVLRERLAWLAAHCCPARLAALADGLAGRDAPASGYPAFAAVAWSGPLLAPAGAPAAEPVAPVAPAADDAAATLANAIRALALGAVPAAPPVDAETVRRIVAEEVERATLPRPVTVTVADLPSVNVGVAHRKLPLLLGALRAGVNVWLAGPAGSGKSHAARQAAQALGVPYYELPALESAAQVTGYRDATGQWRMPPLRTAWEEGGLVLLDEVAGADPRATLALFGGLASGRLAFADAVVERHPQCFVVAADNTTGHGGTAAFAARSRQDGAFLDRFAALAWDYCPDLERALVPQPWHRVMLRARKEAEARKLDRMPAGTRTGQRAAVLAAAGWPVDEVLASCWRGGLTDAQWNDIRPTLAEAVDR